MNTHSEQLLSQVNPVLASKVEAAATNLINQGIEIRVTDGVRTLDEQNHLYQLGRSILTNAQGQKQSVVTNARGGYSSHNFGLAVDVCPGVLGKPVWLPQYDVASFEFKEMVHQLKAQGLAWGGDWKTLKGDYVHFYLANTPPNPTNAMRADLEKGGLSSVFTNANNNVYA